MGCVVGALAMTMSPSTTVDAASAPTPLDRIVTTDPVVFVTIDDGFTPVNLVAEELDEWKWPVTNFVILGPLNHWAGWFARLGPEPLFGDHTRGHPHLKGLPLARQKAEICGGADDVAATTGVRPTWFRPPFGEDDNTTYAAAAACGIRYIVKWRVTVNGPVITTQGGPIRPGDIILLHFRPDLAVSLAVLKFRLDSLGLHPASLDRYLDGYPTSTRAVTKPPEPLPVANSPWLKWFAAQAGPSDPSVING